MNPPSQPAPQTRAFQSWQLVFIAVMLLATVAISTFYFSSAQAQTDNGTITGLTLSSDTPGTLTVSWESASPTPTDYRVDWAKSDEDYQSWKVNDGHVYLEDTATTVTIADLEHDTEYKIRMRARYYRGEHEGKSWGGPWATETITVTGEPAETPTPEPAETPTPEPVEEEPTETPTPEPVEKEPVKKEPGQRPPRSDPPRDDPAPEDTTPAAPSFINTAVTEGQVLLSWSNPADDSITGYQISRGPDADSLVVIEDDTGSSSTTYTDTAPPAGQTHTYGVKARNASGLSPAGIATATVPAAEVLIVARHGSTGNTLVSNLGQTAASTSSVIGPTSFGDNDELGMAFTTGNNPFGYHLTTVQVDMRASLSGDTIPNLSIRADSGGLPSETVLYTFTTSTVITGSWNLVTFTTSDETTLHPNTKYWLHAANTGATAISLRNTDSDDEDSESNIGWQIDNNRYGRRVGQPWTQRTTGNTRMQINGHAIQQKEIIKLGGNGTVDNNAINTIGYREPGLSALTSTRYFGYATSFTPGGDGWYYLSSIGFTIIKDDASLIRVSIHEDNSGGPADAALYIAYVAVDSETPAIPNLTASFPDNATLEAGKTYWAVFDEITGTGTFHLYLAEESNEDAGFESWAIGDVGYEIDYLTATGFTWKAASDNPVLTTPDEPIQMTFHGYAEPERTLVGAHRLRDTADDGPLLRFGTERITKAWLKLPMGQTFDFCEPAFVAGSGTQRSWRRCDLSPSSHHDHEWAGGREFTTGPNPTGYTITALGVDMDAEEGTINPQAAIHSTSAFQTAEGSLDPQSPLAKYQAQADINGSPDRFAPRTGSEEVHLAPNTTYVAYFENDATGYFEAPNARAGQDAGAEDGWTLGYPYGSKFIHPLGFAGEPWNLGDGESKRIPLNIYGWPNPLVAAPNPEPPAPGQTLISNLDLTPGDPFLLQRREFLTRAIASSFMTGSHGAGYALHGLQIELQNQPVEFVGGIRAAIHNDNDGKPGTFLHELGLQVNLQKGIATFHAPASTILAANTTYWLIVSAESILAGTQQVVVVLANWDQNVRSGCYARDWSIGNFNYWRATSTFPWNGSPDAIKMAILGERVSDPSVESSEPTCDDLPESTTTTGRLIVDGDGVKGQHHTQGDADWYSIDLLADTYYQFTANPGKKGLPHYILRIYDDAGVELRNSLITPVPSDTQPYYDAPDRLNSLPFRTDTAGTFYVSIEPWGSNDPDTVYTLVGFDDDYSDNITGAGIVDVGESFQNYVMRTDVNPDSSVTSDVDLIRVALEAGATYEIIYDVACLHEGKIVGIHDPDGMMIPDTEKTLDRQTDGHCTNLTTEFISPSNDNYYIAVSAEGSTFPSGTANPFTGVQGTLTITDITPNYPATGNPLVRGERRVGSTLKGDTAGVADDNGLTNPMLEYQWQRVEDGIQTDIPGAMSDAYRLTDDDEGKRVRLQVRFDDDYGYHEIRSGPATSLVAPEASRILVSNIKQSGSARTTDNISNGFVSGANPHGYVIDEILFERSITTQVSSNDAEFRLYTSTLDNNVRERKPDTRIITISPPYKTSAQNIFFSPQSRVNLAPSTTYHAVFTTRTDETIGCYIVSGGSEDSGSLEGFDILDRFYVYPMGSDSGFTDGSSCVFRIKGFELASSNLVQSVDFTSTPAQPGMYATGELMEATATLTQAVAFDGPPPVILLQIGDNERRMEYFTSESTDTSWVFRYTVVADDRDDDGVSIKQNALRGYADADLSHYGITNDQTSHVNAAPRVVSQRVSSSPLARLRYGPGEKIQFTVEFSLPVTVVGNPRLEFNIDTPAPQNEFASYLSGSDTKELVFSYTVLTVDDDTNGIEWGANSIRVVDGVDEITGLYNGLSAALDHTPPGRLSEHHVTQTPRLVSLDVTSDPTHGTDSDTYGAGDTITFETIFNQAVTVGGSPRLRFSIDSGTGYEYADYVSGSGTTRLIFSYTVLANDADTDGIYLDTSPLTYDTGDSIIGTNNGIPAHGAIPSMKLPGHKVDGSLTN